MNTRWIKIRGMAYLLMAALLLAACSGQPSASTVLPTVAAAVPVTGLESTATSPAAAPAESPQSTAASTQPAPASSQVALPQNQIHKMCLQSEG